MMMSTFPTIIFARISESFVALQLASCPGGAVMYSSYACWHSMSHGMMVSGMGGIREGWMVFIEERITEQQALKVESGSEARLGR